ncbi:hypothetical protein HDF26_003104 [Pedobacter cryoconitis]|uniref:outer membrane beta-barrel protein n=1 Tax=Pedobacter cryoconitis TaxID=188932 RepID=UPI001607726C|nr:outer membrane beta-barrel protein [Pedobacter cryoconitis]MBB6272647.1 hypothetical protein [Pedobacter cryoconitis]
MKKLLTLMMLCASAMAVNAQTEKGKYILGGTIGYSSTKYENSQGASKQNNFDLLPSAGYFVSDNLALGLGIGYSRNVTTSTTSTTYYVSPAVSYANYSLKETTDYFTVSPFIRHYVNISEKFKFFSQFSVPMKWGNRKSEFITKNPALDVIPNTKVKTTSVGVGLEPGFAYFPTKKIGIQLSVGGLSYIWNKTEDKVNSFNNDQKDHAFNLGTNFLAPRIGIQFYL